jgi:hypothetical protein
MRMLRFALPIALVAACSSASSSPPAPPAPAWTVVPSLPGGDRRWIDDLHATSDGVLVRHKTLLIAIEAGVERWRADVPGLVAVEVGRCIAVVGRDLVRCLDERTGREQWRAKTDRTWVTAVWRGDKLLLLGQRGTVAVADPAACARDPSTDACLRPRPQLDGVQVPPEKQHRLAVTASGAWFHTEERMIVAVGPDDVPITRIHVKAPRGQITNPAVTPTGKALVGWGTSIYRIDPGACGRDVEAVRAPRSCLEEVARVDGGDGYHQDFAPIPLGEAALAAVIGNRLGVYRSGVWTWPETPSFPLAVIGDDRTLFVAGKIMGEVVVAGASRPLQLHAVSPDQGRLWTLRLTDLGNTQFFVFAANDRWLYVASDTAVTAVPRN